MIFSESTINDKLWYKYKHAEYRIPNVFIFGWESDFWWLMKSGYNYEIEIKISRADFFNDFKKDKKHQVLKNGWYKHNDFDSEVQARRPNKFYYLVPEGLVTADEVPEYCGLMMIDDRGNIITIKEAPYLHKDHHNFENILCTKFYFYWLQERLEAIRRGREVDALKRKIELLTNPK